MPRLLSHSTTGSIAIDSSHASSSRKRKLPIAWKAHVATESSTIATKTVTMMRRALPGVIAIHRASSSKGTPGTAWLVCRAREAAARWSGCSAWWRAVLPEGAAVASGWSALTRRAYGHGPDERGMRGTSRGPQSGRMADTASHPVETPFTHG